VLLAATGGCVPRTLRTDQLETRLTRELETALGIEGIRVACPTSVEIEEGDVFDCLATEPDGDRLRLRVTQVDDEGGVTWETLEPAE
jgi:hypothetical protein